MENIKEQKYLKTKGLVLLITVMNMIVPLSLDMYLPAVPQMTELFNVSESMVNFTLVGFYFFMSIGILLFGPLSDKYGRKIVLIIGISTYLLFSAGCAIAGTIEVLIGARILQALGAGCMIAVSTALIKDCFNEKKRDTVLAVVQAMAVIGPMVAPVIGAWVITLSGWRMTFWLLAIIGILCLVAVIMLEETLPKEERHSGHILSTLGRLFAVGKNRGFSVFLLANALVSAPYLAYIAVCSYVYIEYFNLSETTYSYYFAVNSTAAILGPIIYLKIKDRIKAKPFMTTCLILSLISGILVLTVGWIAPIVFLLSFIPFTIVESAIRPFSTAILLVQQEKDTGSASSLINFTHTVFGSLGMVLGALGWSSFISGLGILIIGFTVIALISWAYLINSKTPVHNLSS